jgi:germination protein M
VTGGVDDEQRAMEELLAGPNVAETEIGMTTNIPTSVHLLGLSIVDGVATVDLSGSFEESGGTLGETFRLAQVVFTLTQFDTVDTVDLWIDGDARDAVGSHGIPATGLSRADFSDVRPLILVTSPTPGEVLGNSFVIRGESNTFEAGVEYVVVDGEGLIVDQGFTTATAGNGEWGTFSIDIDLDPPVDGRAGIIVFETSAKDGSQQNVVEYPIHIDASAASEECG